MKPDHQGLSRSYKVATDESGDWVGRPLVATISSVAELST